MLGVFNMSDNVCPQCGAPNAPGSSECKYCGEVFAANTASAGQGFQKPAGQQPPFQQNQNQQPPYHQQAYQNPGAQQTSPYQQMINEGISPAWPIKSKIAAGLLGIFLGGLGIHKFYMGKIGMGILYLLFSWTFIPGLIGFIEGIIYLASNEHNFCVKHHVRAR
jgi:TM2 domain-containing membrane protein YozV/ribosomal protein L32